MGVTIAVARSAAAVAPGNQDFTTADLGGLTPKAAFFTIVRATADGTPANGAGLGIGAATSVGEQWAITVSSEDNVGTTNTQRRSTTDECIMILDPNTGAVDGEATFVAFIANGVRVNWGNAPAAAYYIVVELYAGTDLSAQADTFSPNALVNNVVDVNTVGFEPDVIMTGCIGNNFDDVTRNENIFSHGVALNKTPVQQYSILFHDEHGVGTSAAFNTMSDNYAVGQSVFGALTWTGEFGDFDANGFSCTTRLGGSGGDVVGFLALAFNAIMNFDAAIIDTPVGNGNQSQTFPGFMPDYVHCGLCQLSIINSVINTADAGSIGISAFDIDDEFCNSIQSEDGQGTSDTQSLSDNTAVNLPLDSGAAGHVASFVSFDLLGWTWNFTQTQGTAKKWWALAIGAVVVPPPPPPTPVALPVVVAGHHQSRELTLVVKEPLPVSNALISDSLRVDGLRAIWTAQGGHWSLAFNLRGRQSEVEDWIDAGLGRQIELYSPDLMLIWAGYASKISGNIGGLSIARGPLIETVANKMQVAFSTVDYSITPPAVGVRDNTDWVEDAASQAKYGIIERVVSLAGSTLTGAEQVRDTLLGEMAEPISDETDNIGSASETSVTVECLGWVHWLNAYTYFSQTTGDTTASAKIQAVLTADPNGIFSTDYGQIAVNATVVGAWDDDYRRAWDVIKSIVSLGDSSLNRYLFGVYGIRRKAKYNALPTTPKYQRALADPGQWLEIYGSGGHVNPWDVEPGEWVFYTDLSIGKSQPASFRLDYRYLLIEQAQYSAPWGLTLQGGRANRLDQLLAQFGLGGSSG